MLISIWLVQKFPEFSGVFKTFLLRWVIREMFCDWQWWCFLTPATLTDDKLIGRDLCRTDVMRLWQWQCKHCSQKSVSVRAARNECLLVFWFVKVANNAISQTYIRTCVLLYDYLSGMKAAESRRRLVRAFIMTTLSSKLLCMIYLINQSWAIRSEETTMNALNAFCFEWRRVATVDRG